jgi:uncharacterized protein with HEPN domain
METKVKKLMFDILSSLENIENYLGKEKKFEVYNNDSMLQDAVERNIEIIGEAMNKLLMLNLDLEITNSRRIVDARNKIIHGYDEIENAQIWGIIINHLPTLRKEIEKYLAE